MKGRISIVWHRRILEENVQTHDERIFNCFFEITKTYMVYEAPKEDAEEKTVTSKG